ncbi:MAG: short chain dehydrogenase [Candidatus Tectimicrobiota bacterium]|nr:MAG: short chain dehydrogenase [Candidatus Tectomicrobia bacterium]
MADRLRGKVALITGGASGQGRAVAIRFAQEGARVVISDIDAEGGNQTLHLVRESGGEACFVPADVASEASVQALVAAALRQYGALHVLYNNAGIIGQGLDGEVTQLSVEGWNRILDVNLKGVFLCAKHAIPLLIQAGGGSVINVASVAGLIGSPNAGHAYHASKGGVVALTRAMAATYARHNVRVNAICPSTLETPMTAALLQDPARYQQIVAQHPLGRLGTAQDVVGLAVYLASDESAWVTGAIFPVDGGRTAV